MLTGSERLQKNPVLASFTLMEILRNMKRAVALILLHKPAFTASQRGTSAFLMLVLTTVLYSHAARYCLEMELPWKSAQCLVKCSIVLTEIQLVY